MTTDLIKSDRALQFIESQKDNYTEHAKAFTRWIRENNREVDLDSVRDYFIFLNNSAYAAGTICMKRAVVKKRIRQLMQNAPIDDRIRMDTVLKDLDTFGDTRAPKMASHAVGNNKVISESERMILISRATPRLALMMEFLWLTGCRVSEMTGIKIGHCKKEAGAVYIKVTGKGSKTREVQITAAFYDTVRAFYRGEQYLFETAGGKQYSRSYISGQIAKLTKRELGRALGAHCFRHSFATRKIKNTGNLKGVSQYLGHSSTAITSDMYDHNLLDGGDLLEESICTVGS